MNEIIYLETSRLTPHINNPRKDLGDLSEFTESVKANGILQNLTVVPTDIAEFRKMRTSKRKYNGDYIIIIGHRRHAAAKLAELDKIPCIIADMDEKTQLATMLLENMQRSDLTIYEQAQGVQLLLDMGESQAAIAKKTGFSKSTISKRMKLLQYNPDDFKGATERGATLEDFEQLDKIKDKTIRESVLEHAGTNNFNFKLRNALDKEKELETMRKLKEKLLTFAKEIKSTNGYNNFSNIWVYTAESYTIPDDAETVNYYFVDGGNHVKLCTDKTEEEKAAKADNTAKNNADEERLQKLKNLSNQAYELRCDFVKNISDKTAKSKAGVIVKFAAESVISSLLYFNDVDLKSLFGIFGIEFDVDVDNDTAFEIIEKSYKVSYEKLLLVSIFFSLDNNLNYFYELLHKPPEHKFNETLDFVYSFLTALGYEMSDEEKALQSGVHGLFESV
ncbi:MAG: ParB/RepB/Spo0J family partition protein [Oscillospiraceae bacterium]|nr:ParB/RepB/Spo0J family partition protein [Oscillospiraceae bacterium]